MTIKKTVIITLTTVVVLPGLAFLGIRAFTHKIYTQRTCEWCNIDNIELHTMTDIPKIDSCDCNYDQQQNTKTVQFDINKSKVDISEYIIKNRFSKLDSEKLSLSDFTTFKTKPSDCKDLSELYYKKGAIDGENWKMVLNKTSGRLWIILKYAN